MSASFIQMLLQSGRSVEIEQVWSVARTISVSQLRTGQPPAFLSKPIEPLLLCGLQLFDLSGKRQVVYHCTADSPPWRQLRTIFFGCVDQRIELAAIVLLLGRQLWLGKSGIPFRRPPESLWQLRLRIARVLHDSCDAEDDNSASEYATNKQPSTSLSMRYVSSNAMY